MKVNCTCSTRLAHHFFWWWWLGLTQNHQLNAPHRHRQRPEAGRLALEVPDKIMWEGSEMPVTDVFIFMPPTRGRDDATRSMDPSIGDREMDGPARHNATQQYTPCSRFLAESSEISATSPPRPQRPMPRSVRFSSQHAAQAVRLCPVKTRECSLL